MGHKKYHNPPSEPLTFGLTAAISLHAVTTGYQLQQQSDGRYAYLSGHIHVNCRLGGQQAGIDSVHSQWSRLSHKSKSKVSNKIFT